MSGESSGSDVVNHHAGSAGCGGVVGVLAGLAMLLAGRGVARDVVALAGVAASDVVVDLGCGPGGAARRAARAGAGAIGVDPSQAMLWIARLASRRGPGVTWVRAGAERLPLPEACATVLWTVRSVHHWPNVDAGLAEALRVLRPGGAMLAVEKLVEPRARGLRSHGWTARQAEAFARLCRKAGFADVTTAEELIGGRASVVVRAVRSA